ncbi:SGNH/GDSL hydrolase family protein [Candidatus Peregrinibacteria bacterium]|nr:SGNH/GDSL hydrolase family protein [Candidatus Peregrinibacteria bacterium]
MKQGLKRWLGNLAAFCVSLFIMLAAVEVGLRLFVPYATPITIKDPHIYRRMRPNMEMDLEGKDWQSRIFTNEHGWMGPAFDIEKTPGTKRVLHIGDSLVEAIHVNTEKSFVSQLNNLLPGTEHLNLSVAGRGTLLEFLTYRYYGYSYDPDVTIIWFYTGNDFRDNYQNRHLVRKKDLETVTVEPQRLGALKAYLLQNFRLPRFMFEKGKDNALFVGLLVKTGLLSIQPEEVGAEIPLGFRTTYLDTPERGEALKTTELLLQALKQEVTKGRLVLGVIPDIFDLRADLREQMLKEYPALQGQDLDIDFARRELTRIAREQHIPLLDLTEPFRRAFSQGKEPYLLIDGHLSQEGHDITAIAVATYLRGQKFLP